MLCCARSDVHRQQTMRGAATPGNGSRICNWKFLIYFSSFLFTFNIYVIHYRTESEEKSKCEFLGVSAADAAAAAVDVAALVSVVAVSGAVHAAAAAAAV